MKKIIIAFLIICLVLVTIKIYDQNDNSVIKLGFIGPLTGDQASLGNSAKTATEIAVEEINAGGGANGKKIEVIYEDGKCNSSSAYTAYQKLVNLDKVDVVVGGLCSGETSAFIKQAMDSKMVVISYCSSAPSLSSSGKYFFRTYPSDSYQAKYAAEYLFNTLKVTRAAVLYHISDWGNGNRDVFINTFKQLGGEVVAVEGTTQDTRDYKTQLTKVMKSNPEYIFMSMYSEGSLVAISQVMDLRITTPILGTDAWDDTKFIEGVSNKIKIQYISLDANVNKSFQENMKLRTGKDITTCAPQAYDAVRVVAEAINKVGLDSNKLQEAIRSTKITGVTGPLSFDENGDVKGASYIVKQISGGKSGVLK